ncbi:3-hydroxyacyl-CoA dehydrogenase/enoyl-CoA hydratase family protein [Desulfatitalea alkaliphila]|uniref:3-hydroxyacyl-CoA dehydrogenase/enoyl-CoA hydratase family protein n=1 Tax=Desulfatitalea alkaliphila TaxID=2929485 RepID=A0AA41UNW0_9BACT|nr:3-hydroxyacyl-CoA dehydrogenase/enoyl-CoA hydratase family protein [Desulfatitalea alkaliphila]MCJ8499888.1 3-hydroxyacyl-CoA dehydrogenase/enoyl-CoA hydratase family protein [Desulfatitalea alkaliphila]
MVRKIRQAAVIGSGVMGGGIAALLASAGIKTLLLDIVPPDLKDEEKKDPKARNRIVMAGLENIRKAKPAALMQRKDIDLISIGNMEDDFDKLAGCDWIVEVVVENLKIKQDLLKRLEKVRKADAVISSNTSGIPLKAMSEGLSKEFKQHFLGTHFFNPVRYMKLLEIIPGEETLPEVLQFMAEFGERKLGKGIVWAKDTPNFVGNRIGAQSSARTMQLVVEMGMTVPEVDALFGPAMGRPKTGMFKTIDLVGLDIMSHVAKNTYDLVQDDEARESFVLPDFIDKMLEKKMLGNKTKGGFYKTDLTPEWKKIRKVIDLNSLEYNTYDKPSFPCLEAAAKAKTPEEKIQAMVFGDDKGSQFVWRAVAENLIYAANRIPEIADTIVEVDNAMRWGFGQERGPFEGWDLMGVQKVVDRMEKDGLPVPEKIKKMLAGGNQSFYKVEGGKRFFFDFASASYKPIETSPTMISLDVLKADNKTVLGNSSATLVDLGDGVFCAEFHTKMNSLNDEIVEFLEKAHDYVDANGVGLVIGNQAGGMPGAFSAGADLRQVYEGAQAGAFADIEAAVKRLQEAIQLSRYSHYPVVAAPFGLALGGGAEICLGADRIVAHADLFIGLVEIGVGLLPGGTGCSALWRKVLENVPESVGEVELTKFFLPVFQAIAMAKVSMSAAEARATGFLGPKDRIIFNRDHLIGEAKKEVLRMADDGYTPPFKRPLRVFGEAAQGMVRAELLNMQAAGYVSEYDAYLVKRIATVISGGQARTGAYMSEDALLAIERATFVDLLRQEKTLARIDHMLKTGKPLRN